MLRVHGLETINSPDIPTPSADQPDNDSFQVYESNKQTWDKSPQTIRYLSIYQLVDAIFNGNDSRNRRTGLPGSPLDNQGTRTRCLESRQAILWELLEPTKPCRP